MRTKLTLIVAAVIILTSSAAAAPIIEEFDIDPESPETGEEFTVTVTAEDTRDEVMEIGLDWSETPSNWDSSSEYRFCGDVSCTEEWDVVFEEEGEYEVMAEAVNYRDESERQFQTVNVERDLEPISLELEEPEDSAEDLELRPEFSWSVSGGEGDIISDFYLKEKSFDGEKPWTDPDFSEDDAGTSFSLDEDLEYDTEYVWGINAEDQEQQSTNSSRTFVTEEEPEADINADFSFDPENPLVDEDITFDASDSEADNDIIEYEWDFDDSTTTTTDSETVEHSYSSEGDYDVLLTIEDDEGNTDSRERTVSVEEAEKCGIDGSTVGDLELEDTTITRGESTEASIQVENTGEDQDVKVEISADGETYLQTTETVEGGETKTFDTDVSPDTTSLVTAEVETVGDPCGNREIKTSTKELTVLTPSEDYTELDVIVENKTGDRLEDVRVEVENTDEKVGFTDENGLADFRVKQGDYTITVSKDKYSTQSKDVRLTSDYREFKFTLDKSEDKGKFNAIVRDAEDSSRLEDAKVKVSNSDEKEKKTNRFGRASFDLKPDEYDVKVSKDEYGTIEDLIEIEAGETKTETYYLRHEDDKRGIRIKDMDYNDEVCKGDTLEVETTIENLGGYHEVVTLTGTGLGTTTVSSSFSLSENETKTRTFRFTNVEGDGETDFRITATNRESDSKEGKVNVKDCPTDRIDKDDVTGLTAEIRPREIMEGDTAKVRGYVRGVRGSTTVNINVDGQKKAQVATKRDGYYETYIRPKNIGKQTVTISAGGKSTSRTIDVLPTSRVESVNAPRQVFEGETFEVCAEVSSQATPKVFFEKNDRVLETRNAAGELCFEDTASDPGTHVYTVNSLTHDQTSSGSVEVEVLEMRNEAEMFPDRFASIRSGSGIISVDLYNNNPEQKSYNLNIEGIDDKWVTQSSKNVILNPGEPKTAYFYFTPRAEGEFRPTINVEKDDEVVYSEEVIMEIGGRDRPERRSFLSRLRAFFSL